MAGCGSGQVAQTAQEVPVVNGASGEAGPIAVRNAQLAFPPTPDGVYRQGSSAPVLLAIVNSGDKDDRLVSGTSPIGTVDISGNTTVPARYSVYTAGVGGQASHPSSPPSPSAVPTSTPPSTSQSPAIAPPTGSLSIVLRSLKQDIAPGQTAQVTLLFQNAGEVTLTLPIATPADAGQSVTAPTSAASR
jgi:copper(I)-binding protein